MQEAQKSPPQEAENLFLHFLLGNIGFLLDEGNQITGKHLPGKKEPLPCTENNIRFMYFQKRNCAASFSNFHIHVSVSNLYIPMIDPPILLQNNMRTDPGNI
jgi:hypothetical protein